MNYGWLAIIPPKGVTFIDVPSILTLYGIMGFWRDGFGIALFFLSPAGFKEILA